MNLGMRSVVLNTGRDSRCRQGMELQSSSLHGPHQLQTSKEKSRCPALSLGPGTRVTPCSVLLSLHLLGADVVPGHTAATNQKELICPRLKAACTASLMGTLPWALLS